MTSSKHVRMSCAVPVLMVAGLLFGAYPANKVEASTVRSAMPSDVSATVRTAVAAPFGEVFAINAGGGATSYYSADSHYTLGSVYSNTSRTVSTAGSSYPAPAAVYQDEREGDHFSYKFTGLQRSTVYTVILHFAELYWTLPEQREFNVSINGTLKLSNFDIVAEAGGPFRAVDELFFVRSDAIGNLKIDFLKGAADQPLVNGIEIRLING